MFYGSDPDDASTIHHVAMYMGGGRVVEARRAGVPVQEGSLRMSGSMTWAGRP